MAEPNSFRDPLYAGLASATEKKLSLPAGLLSSIITNGERSNADQVSSAGARTVAQIIPSTRKAVLDKYGIDAYLSPENAVEAAGLILKEGLDRNKGDAELAVREYHGGTDRANWGKVNDAYAGRVMAGQQGAKTSALDNDFAKWMAANPPATIDTTGGAAQAPKGQDALSAGFADYLKNQRDGAGQIPGQAPGNQSPPSERPVGTGGDGLGDQLLGAGEAALNLGTGLVGGTVGMVGGAAKGLADAVMSGQFGTPEGANAVEQAAAQGAEALTYQPRTAAGQNMAGAVGQGMQQLIPMMPMAAEVGAMGRAAAPVARAITDQTQANVAGAAQLFQASTDAVARRLGKAPAEAPAAPMAGEQLTQTAKTAAGGSFGSKQATTDLAAQAAPDPKVLQAAQRLGIEDHLQPDHVTTNQAYRELSQAVKSIPGSETRAAELVGLEKVAERANKVIDDIGGSTDLSSVDSGVKARMRSSIDELSSRSDGLYAKVREAVPAKTEAPPTTTLEFLKNHADELGGANRLLPAEKNLLAKISGEDGPVTYAYLDQTRKQIGQAQSKASGPFAESESGLLKKLYSTLSDDQQSIADANGAGDVFRAAKSAVAVRKGLEDDMQSLFGRALDQSIAGKLPGAVKASAQGNTAPLLKILSAVPDDMRQSVVASGVATSFRNAATKGDINFGSYAKWFEGLQRNRQAYTAVMSNLPAPARRNLIDLYRVANGISAATRERITTGRITAISDQFKVADSLASRLYEYAQRGAVGAAVGTVTTPILGPGVGAALASVFTKGAKPAAIKAVDALIASPEFLRAVKAAGTPQQEAAVSALARSPAFSRFVRETGPRAVGNREQWLIRAMQASPAAQGQASRDPHGAVNRRQPEPAR